MKKYPLKELKREELRIKDWGFDAQQRGEQPILLCDFFGRAVSTFMIQNITGERKFYNYLFTDSSRLYKYPKEAEICFGELLQRTQDRPFLHKIIALSLEIPQSFHTSADQVTEAIKDVTITNEKLAEYWQKMDDDFLKVVPWFWYPWYLSKENILTDKVKKGLERHRKEVEKITDLDDALITIVFPVRKTAFQLEQQATHTLVSVAGGTENFSEDPSFKKEADTYLKKYDWLTTFMLTPLLPMSYEKLVERVKQAQRENFIENFSSQKKAAQKNSEIAQKVFELVKDDQELVSDIEDARELGYVLTAGIEEAYISSARHLPFLELVAKRISIPFQDIKYLLSSEIYSALTGQKSIDLKDIEERKKGFVMMMLHEQQYVKFGEEAHTISQWVDRELNKVDSSLRELKGTVACKGHAKGKVRIAFEPSQAHLIKEGEILVCPMTNPDYVPAMRRSSAIVTDEGGLLSHASIMSREFNKPCIIGTKIATQVLKDGMLVEVDAERGVVRILEKANTNKE